MIVRERLVQTLYPGKWQEWAEINKKYDTIEARHGMPRKDCFQCIAGLVTSDTVIIARSWPSLAAAEETYQKVMADPEWQALVLEGAAIVKESYRELYTPI